MVFICLVYDGKFSPAGEFLKWKKHGMNGKIKEILLFAEDLIHRTEHEGSRGPGIHQVKTVYLLRHDE
jgi:hypothetical protein